MLFNSIDFFLFFSVVYALYLSLSHKWQNALLLVSSYFFYGSWDVRFLSLIVVSTVVDFWAGLRIESSSNERTRRLYLLASLLTNLTLLGFFKYFDFFVGSAYDLLAVFGVADYGWRLHILLPVGISFYTFQTMSYTLDVYARQLKPTRDFVDFATFVAFFPQLVAGPIERAVHLLPQIQMPRRVTWECLRIGVWLICWGLFKKVVIADNLSPIVDQVFDGEVHATSAALWIAIYAFAIQIYCDFSGYTDMARGVGRCMGFDLVINFRNPYFATNPVDFWQRWHISLSRWFQDYLYFPLAVHYLRKSQSLLNQYKPHLYAMTLIGLWHGANMTFVAFGVFWGVVIITYQECRRMLKKARPSFRVSLVWRFMAGRTTWSRYAGMVATFHIACVAFVFFRSPSLLVALEHLWTMFTPHGTLWLLGPLPSEQFSWLFALVVLATPLVVVQILQENRNDLLAPMQLSIVPRTVLFSTILLMLLTLGNAGGQAFIYFQF
jgi:alginate O-acetyltransferase complex protein AlgI